MGARTGLFAAAGSLNEALGRTGLVLALLKVQFVLKSVAPHGHVHIFGRILGRTGAQTVQAQRELIVLSLIVLVLAACVQLAEDQFPVIALLVGVPLDRDTASHVLDLDRAVGVSCDRDLVTIALTRLVNGVG